MNASAAFGDLSYRLLLTSERRFSTPESPLTDRYNRSSPAVADDIYDDDDDDRGKLVEPVRTVSG